MDVVSSQDTPEGLAVLGGIWAAILLPWMGRGGHLHPRSCVFVEGADPPLKYLPEQLFFFHFPPSLRWQRSTGSCPRGRSLGSQSRSLAPPPPSSPSGCCPRSRRVGRHRAAKISEPPECPHLDPPSPAPSTCWRRLSHPLSSACCSSPSCFFVHLDRPAVSGGPAQTGGGRASCRASPPCPQGRVHAVPCVPAPFSPAGTVAG